jgi:RNA methyltransferase, TrmH family
MADSLLTLIRDLGRRRGRERRGLTLAEGVRLVEEALTAGVAVHGAVIGPSLEGTDRGRALKDALDRANVRQVTVTAAELEKLADTEHPQGIVAVIEPPSWSLADIEPAARRPVLVLDGVQDPGNVGTMLRTALGLGAAGAVALPGTAELTNPKVVRGAMGALFRLPSISATDAELFEWLGASGVELWAAAMDGEPVGSIIASSPPAAPVIASGAPAASVIASGTPAASVIASGEAAKQSGRPAPIAIVIGNEGAGVRPALLNRASRRVAIPLRGPAESLNAAIAAAILLYEVTRER